MTHYDRDRLTVASELRSGMAEHRRGTGAEQQNGRSTSTMHQETRFILAFDEKMTICNCFSSLFLLMLLYSFLFSLDKMLLFYSLTSLPNSICLSVLSAIFSTLPIFVAFFCTFLDLFFFHCFISLFSQFPF